MQKLSSALVGEALGTFLLVLAVCAVAFNPRARQEWAPFAIGTTLGFAVMIFGPLTGGSFNPARWFGPALVANEWDDFWVWIIGPTVGALLAAVSYWFLFVVERPGWTIPGGPPAPDMDDDAGDRRTR